MLFFNFREQQNQQTREAANKNSMVACGNCSRTFLPDRLVVHQRSCKGSRPATRTISRTSFDGPPEPKKFNVRQ